MKLLGNILLVASLAAVVFAARAETNSQPLSLPEAHENALKNHPRISVAELRALAAKQTVRQVQSAFFPNISANVVSVGTAGDNTRLEANGGLNNPIIYERNAEGLTVSQLLFDFGRTWNLSKSSKFHAAAEEQNTAATREQVLVEVDAAFYSALEAQAIRHVADQTIAARRLFLDRVSMLASNQLRSELDVSFARVNLEEAQLLQNKAQNDAEASFAQLTALLGSREQHAWQLVEPAPPAALPPEASPLVEDALLNRPDLLRLRNERDAATRLASAEKAARYPTVSAVGNAGVSPIHSDSLPDNYAAAGLVVTMPLFAGGYYSARQHEAELRARAASETLRDLENNTVRDVRIAWLNSKNALDRVGITTKLLQNANQSLNLAQAKYDAGSSSIVELNQAQLNQVSAEIATSNTRYEYLLSRSVLNFQTGSLH